MVKHCYDLSDGAIAGISIATFIVMTIFVGYLFIYGIGVARTPSGLGGGFMVICEIFFAVVVGIIATLIIGLSLAYGC
jgi:hypothetical protein